MDEDGWANKASVEPKIAATTTKRISHLIRSLEKKPILKEVSSYVRVPIKGESFHPTNSSFGHAVCVVWEGISDDNIPPAEDHI